MWRNTSNELAGCTAIVTGAGQGIGKSAAFGLARAGANVVVNDLDEAAAVDVAEEIKDQGGNATTAVAAIGGGSGARTIVDRSIGEFDGIDILVNSAGLHNDTLLADMRPEKIAQNVDVNVLGTILLTRLVVGHLRAQGKKGKIVNITSRAGGRGKAGESVYSAGKAAIAGFTLALAHELAPFGINVNAIAPAAWTPMLEQMEEPFRSQTIEKRKGNVLGRVAVPDDVVETIMFLASERSEYLTGQILQATGQPSTLF